MWIRVLLLLVLSGCERRLLRDLEPPAAPPRAGSSVAPADARGWYLRALALERDGDAAAADHAFRWAVRLDRANPEVHVHYARFLVRQGRPADAIEALGEAQERAPGDPDVQIVLGDAWAASGDPAKAAGFWSTAAEAGAPEAWPRLVQARRDQGDRDGAIAAWDRWREAEIEGGAALARGRAAVALGRDAEAVDDLVLGLTGFGSSPEDGVLLVEAATRACRLGTAWGWARDHRILLREDPAWAGVAQRLEGAAPCPAEPWLSEARTLAASAAVPVLERALDADPFSPDVLDALRAAYDGSGMMAAARQIEVRRSWSASLGAR